MDLTPQGYCAERASHEMRNHSADKSSNLYAFFKWPVFTTILLFLLVSNTSCSPGIALESTSYKTPFNNLNQLNGPAEVVIEGVVRHKMTQDPIPFASLRLISQNGELLDVALSDFEGRYHLAIDPLQGEVELLELNVSSLGYQTLVLSDLPVNSGRCAIQLSSDAESLEAFHTVGAIDHFNMKEPGNSGSNYNQSRLQQSPYR